MPKTKDQEGNVKTCNTCNREMNGNHCETHSESLSAQPCYYCHLIESHVSEWGDDKNTDKEIPVNPSEGGYV